MVSTRLKHISQNGNLPQVGVKIKIFETTTQVYIFLHLVNLLWYMVGKYTIPMDGMGYMFHIQCLPRDTPGDHPRGGKTTKLGGGFFSFYPFWLVCWKSNFHVTLMVMNSWSFLLFTGIIKKLPTKTMHCWNREIPQNYHEMCILWFHPKWVIRWPLVKG